MVTGFGSDEVTGCPRFSLGDACFVHSAFAPENLITLAHFSVSATMSVDSSRGDIGSGTLLRSAIRDPRPQPGIGERGADVAGELVNDIGGRARGRAKAEPGTDL